MNYLLNYFGLNYRMYEEEKRITDITSNNANKFMINNYGVSLIDRSFKQEEDKRTIEGLRILLYLDK